MTAFLEILNLCLMSATLVLLLFGTVWLLKAVHKSIGTGLEKRVNALERASHAHWDNDITPKMLERIEKRIDNLEFDAFLSKEPKATAQEQDKEH